MTLVDDAPQGTVFRVEDGVATVLHVGAGVSGAGGYSARGQTPRHGLTVGPEVDGGHDAL